MWYAFPGTYPKQGDVVPDGAVLTSDPPAYDMRSQILGWDGDRWHVAGLPLAELRAMARAEVAQKRWVREVAGVEFAGRLVDTGREARATLDQAARLGYAGPWKFADGSFAAVTSSDLEAMAAAVMAHVAACYAGEAAAAAAIDAAETFEEVQAAVAAFDAFVI